MKKSIVAIILVATLAAPALVASCGEQTTIAQPQVIPNRPGDFSEPILTPEEQVLQEMLAQQLLESEVEITAGQSPEQTLQTIQDIEEAQRSLRGLEETRGMIYAVMGNQVASGELSAEQMQTALGAVDQARQEVLARVGLVP